MIALLAVLCGALLVAAAGFFVAWGKAERRAVKAEERAERAEARLAERREAEARMAAHWQTVPRERPVQRPAELPTRPLPPVASRVPDPAPTRRLHVVIPYRVPRKDHLL